MNKECIGGPLTTSGSKFTADKSSRGQSFSCVGDLDLGGEEQRNFVHPTLNTLSGSVWCDSCKIVFDDEEKKTIHNMAVHSRSAVGVCVHCGVDFYSQDAFKAHMTCHPVSEGYRQVFRCKYCTRELSLFCHLERHMTCHSVQKPNVCNKCGRSYKRKQDLQKHQRKLNCFASHDVDF